MNAPCTTGVSQQAERVQWLRRQRAELQHWVANPLPANDGRSKAARQNRKVLENLGRVDEILRQLASLIIAGRYA
jgi:uncharacterized protein YaeQ